ncbi:MAG: hypothetical protein HY851_09020 [candidate division Zixibacteria bacterium]|nr:hypothetical protein [candidate division Zixibacteria bacterium]
MSYRTSRFPLSAVGLLLLWLGIAEPISAQSDTTGVSFFAGAGGSTTFGSLYERARFGGNGLAGLAIRFSPGNTSAFELAATVEGAYFFNDGRIGGDLILSNGGVEFRLVEGLRQPIRYFFGMGVGLSRVRERIYDDQITGRKRDGYIEWGPYFAPSAGFDFPVSKKMRMFGMFRYMNVFGNRISAYQYLSFFAGIRL